MVVTGIKDLTKTVTAEEFVAALTDVVGHVGRLGPRCRAC
jgi:hypothetical protein